MHGIFLLISRLKAVQYIKSVVRFNIKQANKVSSAAPELMLRLSTNVLQGREKKFRIPWVFCGSHKLTHILLA
jgi:hypothetical protein